MTRGRGRSRNSLRLRGLRLAGLVNQKLKVLLVRRRLSSHRRIRIRIFSHQAQRILRLRRKPYTTLRCCRLVRVQVAVLFCRALSLDDSFNLFLSFAAPWPLPNFSSSFSICSLSVRTQRSVSLSSAESCLFIFWSFFTLLGCS